MVSHSIQLSVILEDIRSAYNVGSVFRTCEAAGINHLYLTGYTAVPPSPKLDKTALGAISTVPWEHHCQATGLVTYLKGQHIQIWAAEPTAQAVSLYQTTLVQNTCLIFGNEVRGISPALLDLADKVIKIPQFGRKESLNIATAAGIMIYECRRQLLMM